MNEAQTMATITGLVREIHETAVEHGWWDCETCEGEGELPIVEETGEAVLRGGIPQVCRCPTCKGTGEHRNVGELIALAHSELSEALEAKRSPGLDGVCDKCDGSGGEHMEGEWAPCGKCKLGDTGQNSGKALGGSRFAEELADVLIRVLDMAGGLEVDIASAVISKMAHNKTRPYKHGGRAF